MKQKKGQAFPYVVGGAFILLVLAVIFGGLMYFGVIGGDTAAFVGKSGSATTDVGVPVDSLAAFQTNSHTKVTEGANDLEFWDKGADITDTSLNARETLTFSSGAVTDTTVASLRSKFGPSDMDLYIEGGSAYYDDPISEWAIQYNTETGKGVLDGPGVSNSFPAVDVGTFADIDAPEALDTGFGTNSSTAIHYDNSSGDGSAYIRIEIGNDEVDSDLRDVVFCVGDTDSDLEGNEFTAMTISLYTGNSVGSINSNLLPLFSQSAGTGGYECTPIGDIVGLKKGTYQIDFTIDEDLFTVGEDLDIGLDDLGRWSGRQYPSANLKATAEDLSIGWRP